MSKHIGIVGCSAEGAALCYRTICAEAEARMGEHDHPEVSMHTNSLAEYMSFIEADDWAGVAGLMRRSAAKLAEIGADFAICPDNTIHQAYDAAVEGSPIPWLHIAETVAAVANRMGYRRLGITGTAFLVSGPVYPAVLDRTGIAYEVPEPDERAAMNAIIFEQLVKGLFTDASRAVFSGVFESLREKGCDAVVMGCTEIPILMDGIDTTLPKLDSTRILARAALARALEE